MEDINIYGYMRVSSKEQNEDRQKNRINGDGEYLRITFYMDKTVG